MTSAQGLFFDCVLILVVLVGIALIAYRYRSIKTQLNAPAGAIKIHPKMPNFLFAWYVYLLCFLVPMLLVIWLFSRETSLILFILAIEIIFGLILTLMSYPYYTIIISEGTVSGPTLWNWMWRREKIKLNEIDREKLSNRNIGRKLGILVFYSVDGKKILSLGLDDSQVNQILEYSTKSDEPI